ncbi:MAG: murein L,D-transpeptidase [Actinobacteria bacterium]|nr:MAG: murein L,D-transpeptidase [Actinomycetota bacterium]
MKKNNILTALLLVSLLSTLTACGTSSKAQSIPPTTVAPTTTTTLVETGISASGQRSGPSAQASQLKLLELGFWLADPNGKFDDTTTQAVMAFQKYFQLRPTGSINVATAFLLDRISIPATATTKEGSLAEVDKSRQLLFLVQDGITTYVMNASTGDDRAYEEPDANTPGVMIKGTAVTPVGSFKIDRERPDGWWIGDLGQIYRPKYFSGGVAIHGSMSVPAYPSSHGCVRLTTKAMDFIWDNDILPRGTHVLVYGEIN